MKTHILIALYFVNTFCYSATISTKIMAQIQSSRNYEETGKIINTCCELLSYLKSRSVDLFNYSSFTYENYSTKFNELLFSSFESTALTYNLNMVDSQNYSANDFELKYDLDPLTNITKITCTIKGIKKEPVKLPLYNSKIVLNVHFEMNENTENDTLSKHITTQITSESTEDSNERILFPLEDFLAKNCPTKIEK